MKLDVKNDVAYICNPDVVLREEDESGALLYNPDTNQVKVINTTGLFIWKQFLNPNQVGLTVTALRKSFDEVPEETVEADVKEFIQAMLTSGFIGIVEE